MSRCLWDDLTSKEAVLSREDFQRALVLLSTASHMISSHMISSERRKVAWGKINPKLKTLASEEYNKCEANLFGLGFLEKVSKRIEVTKPCPKLPTPWPGTRTTKSDLRIFWGGGVHLSSTATGNSRAASRTSFPRSFNQRGTSKNPTRVLRTMRGCNARKTLGRVSRTLLYFR